MRIAWLVFVVACHQARPPTWPERGCFIYRDARGDTIASNAARCEALIGIAHPAFRDEQRAWAQRERYL